MADFTVIMFIISLAAKRGYYRRDFDVQKALSYRQLDSSIYAELSKIICEDEMRAPKVMRHRRSLYGLKNAARI